MTYFVQRENGTIVGLFANLQPGLAEEELAEDHADVLAFLNPPPSIAQYADAIQQMIDATAQARQFHDGVTLASYTASTNPVWAAEAQAFVAWRDSVWTYAYGEFAKVLAGQRPQPTVAEIVAELPPMVWPTL